MKNLTLQKSVLLIALVFLPLMSFANAFSFVKLTSKENKVITLRIGSAQSEMTHIKLKDQFGHVFYSESVKNIDGILKNFDLSHLESGKYEIELENELNIKVLPMTITWDSVSIAHDNFTTYYKPFFTLRHNSKVDINFSNLQASATSIKIIDDKGNLVYKESLGTDKAINKRYDVSSLEKGEYQFIVQNNGRSYKKSIVL